MAYLMCPCVHLWPRSCPLSGLSLVSLALCGPLTMCPHHLRGASPPQYFSVLHLLPANLYLPPHLPHSYPNLIYSNIYLPCTLLALVPLYLLYSVEMVEIAKGVSGSSLLL